jgi:hypothetical protein
LVAFQGVGHAPTLVAADQVEAVAAFLLNESDPDEEPRSRTG